MKTLLTMTALTAAAAFGGSLPQSGLQVHFRADDQSALNNGAGATQWQEITNWQGGGAAAPLLKRVVIGEAIRYAPHFVTNGFERADGTWQPAVRFSLNEKATGRYSGYTPLATDAMSFNITGTESTWFFAFNGITAGEATLNWKGYWGMANASDIGWYYGLATREDPPNSKYYAWGGGTVLGSGFIGAAPVVDGKKLIDLRDRYKTKISCGYVNGTLINTANWVETVAQPVNCRLAIGHANDRLEDSGASAPIDVAELVIYNRALSDAECVIVREALTARWGIPNESALYAGAATGYCDELVAVGSSTATGSGRIAGSVETSGDSSGLTLSVPAGSISSTTGYVFAAHNGGAAALAFDAALARRRLARAWRVESTFTTAPAVTLSFDLAELGLDGLSSSERATISLVGMTSGTAFKPVSGAEIHFTSDTATASLEAGALVNGVYTLAVAAELSPAAGISLPQTGLQVHFRADDQAALNNGAGATQWQEVTNWQGGGVVAPLLKRVVINGTLKNVPHFTTNAFTRADGNVIPGVRFCVNEKGTARQSAVSLLATDAMQFGFNGTNCTWFFAFNGIPVGDANLNSKQFWGMANASANKWFLGLATRNNNSGKSCFYAWGSAKEIGTSLIDSSVIVEAGLRLIDVRGRYKKQYSTGYMNGERSTAHNWVETTPQPTDSRLAIGNAQDSLEGDVWSAAPMDMGELAIYNRALNDAERIIVREALTARWGLPTANILYAGAATGYCDDLVGVGSSTTTGSGFIPGVVETSSSCRGLSLAVTPGALNGMSGYVFAAGCAKGSYDSAAVDSGSRPVMRMANTWRIETSLATWPDVALVFNLSGYDIAAKMAENPSKALLLKKVGNSFAAVEGVLAVYDAATGVVAFGCQSGTLDDGVYTAGVVEKSGSVIVIR